MNLYEDSIKRLKNLLKELSLDYEDSPDSDYEAGFDFNIYKNGEYIGNIFLDLESSFFEINYIFSFHPSFIYFLQNNIKEILDICYENGVLLDFFLYDEEAYKMVIANRIYISALNYDYLKEMVETIIRAKEDIEILIEKIKDENND